jgi:hypothetical protein
MAQVELKNCSWSLMIMETVGMSVCGAAAWLTAVALWLVSLKRQQTGMRVDAGFGAETKDWSRRAPGLDGSQKGLSHEYQDA